MCGIVAYCGLPSQGRREEFRRLCREACIRGVHAFGIAYHDGRRVQVFKSLSFADVMNAVPRHLPSEIVFHNRYCTSGDYTRMENNQPLIVGGDALAFNGTVDMGTKQEMEERHDLTMETENDGEIVLQDIRRGMPFHTIGDQQTTFAGVYLGADGEMFAFRNEMRPLWQFPLSGGRFIVSTRDIASRAKIDTKNGTPINPYTILHLGE